jgi:hypothetical protein
MQEIARSLIKVHNEEVHSLYYSPDIMRMTKSMMRWIWHVARRK